MHFPDIVYAIHNFEAENEDEMTFRYGEPIVILEKDDQYLDGWWQGRNTLGQTGLFPKNYTSPEKPPNTNNRIVSYNDDIYHHMRMSSGTSSATISSDEYRATNTIHSSPSTEDIANVSASNTTFGVSNSSPFDWNMEEVVTWLDSVGLESFADNFIDQDITGDVLLSLDHNALKELGIHAYGRRYKVLNAIKSLIVSTTSQSEASNDRQSASAYYSRYGSVTENFSNNKTNSVSSLKSSVSSTTPRSAVPANLSAYRHSLSTRSNNSNNNDAHSSCAYSENSSLMLETRPSSNSTAACKRSTFDSHLSALPSTPSIHQRHTLSDVSMYDPSKATVPPAQQSSNSTFPECEGWIYKQSDRYKTWNKRWFVLHGTNLFYFKNPKDSRMKGIIHLRGYRVVLQDANSHSASTKKYHFKLHHDQERTFFLYTSTVHDMKRWVQVLMKSTIQRDLCVPVVSSNTVNTVPLEIAQQMKPRPPSTLMCSNKDRKVLNYRQAIKNDVVSNALEEELDETLLWMEHPSDQDEEPYQKLIIRSYPSPKEEEGQQDEHVNFHYTKQREQSYFFATPTQAEKEVYPRYHSHQHTNEEHPHAYDTNPSISLSSSKHANTNDAILYWVNRTLAPTIEIYDLGSAFRSGQVLIQLLETLSGQSIALEKTQASASMNTLDSIVEAFEFMNREGIFNNGYTIKDVFSGNEEKIVDMILSIKIWSEEKQNRALQI
ncbi:uncharacterized protein ATC70_006102 [Mucor velutinosus]|uniref:Uncharacterized protein n=1 Tax=Mucor velutinosus TaxID=708070 RepID=A0AAN7DCN5_9FUNG|nr:hypothetical protein ATC70_006102 [Mucor velutinosus]